MELDWAHRCVTRQLRLGLGWLRIHALLNSVQVVAVHLEVLRAVRILQILLCLGLAGIVLRCRCQLGLRGYDLLLLLGLLLD